MICEKCGTQNAEGIENCVRCGEPLQQEPTQNPKSKKTTLLDFFKDLPGNKEKLIALIAVAAAALIFVVIILCLIFGGNSPKAVAEKYVKGATKPNYSAVVKLIHKDVLDEADDDDIRDNIKLYNRSVKRLFEETYGDSWKIDITSVDEDELKKSKLRDIKDYYDDEYDLEVTDAREVEIEVDIEGEDEDGEEEFTIIVIKIGGKWYLHNFSLWG